MSLVPRWFHKMTSPEKYFEIDEFFENIFPKHSGLSVSSDENTIYVYPNNLKNWNLDGAKAPGLSDRKRVNINNIDPLAIAQSRELSRSSKSNSSGCLGIEADVPGLTAKEVDISIDEENILWIKGEKKEEDKNKKYYRKSQSSFSYAIPLWEEVDHTSVKAKVKDGKACISFPKLKKKEAAAKKIRVEEE